MNAPLFSSPLAEPRPLRDYQSRAIDLLRESLRSGRRRPLLQLPTGAGKTRVAAEIIRGALNKGKRAIFTVPAISLVDQTVAAFEREGIGAIGVMQGWHYRTDSNQPVQVASVQTLARRQIPEAAIVLVDEAHQTFESVTAWMADPAWAAVPFIGLSATPWSKGLGKHFDDLLQPVAIGDMIEQNHLSPFRVFAPPGPNLAGVRTVAGEFHEGDLAEACDRPELVGDIVQTWLDKGEGRPTLAYGVDRNHAKHLQERFLEAGVAADYIDCRTDRAEREKIFARFRDGQCTVICNITTLTTGIDLDVRCIIDAHPTKSEIRFVQVIGRGLRTAPGKSDCRILDHAGNHLRLGLVTEIHHAKLDDGMRANGQKHGGKAPAQLKTCKSCKLVLLPNERVCPACGTEIEIVSTVRETGGDLVELGSAEAARNAPSRSEQVSFWMQVQGYAREKGHADGWAAHKYRERFGHWPNDPYVRNSPPAPCGVKVRNWIKSRQIAFAKSASGRLINSKPRSDHADSPA